MKTSLRLGISSISISVIFWGLIMFANVFEDHPTAIALGLGWFFFGCPAILVLSVMALMKAFKKPNLVQEPVLTETVRAAKIVSIVSAVLLVAPFIIGVVVIPLLNYRR